METKSITSEKPTFLLRLAIRLTADKWVLQAEVARLKAENQRLQHADELVKQLCNMLDAGDNLRRVLWKLHTQRPHE